MASKLTSNVVDKSFSVIFSCDEVPVHWHANIGAVDMGYVRVVFSEQYGRKAATEDFERNLNIVWHERLKKNPNLYNGNKFRLAKLSLESDFVKVYLGLTCYRDFICTNMATEHVNLLNEYGRKYYNDDRACFSDALGEEAVVLSSDNQVVFVKRSDRVYEAAGQFALPGGHPEPDVYELCALTPPNTWDWIAIVPGTMIVQGLFVFPNHDYSGIIYKKDMLTPNSKLLQELDSEDFVYELYHSMVREVRDEINIPEKYLEFPTLLGIGRNEVTNGRPEMIFLIRCSLSSQEIRKFYNEGGPEAYESTQLMFVHVDELQRQISSCNDNPSDEMKELLANTTPGTFASIKLFFSLKRNV